MFRESVQFGGKECISNVEILLFLFLEITYIVFNEIIPIMSNSVDPLWGVNLLLLLSNSQYPQRIMIFPIGHDNMLLHILSVFTSYTISWYTFQEG